MTIIKIESIETQPIVDAINNLIKEPTFFDMYMFPIISWIIAFGTGWLLANMGFNKQLKHQRKKEKLERKHQKKKIKLEMEKEKLFASNNLLLSIIEAFNALTAYKNVYLHAVDTHPINRVFNIPYNDNNHKPIDFMISTLSFLVYKKKDYISGTWVDIIRVSNLIKNYNYFLLLFDERNKLILETHEILLSSEKKKASISKLPDYYLKEVGPLKLTYLIDRTEQLINLVDNLILEIRDFFLNFRTDVKHVIDLKFLKMYDFNLFTYDLSKNEQLDKILKKSTELDYQEASKITGRKPEEMKENYTKGFLPID